MSASIAAINVPSFFTKNVFVDTETKITNNQNEILDMKNNKKITKKATSTGFFLNETTQICATVCGFEVSHCFIFGNEMVVM